MKKRIIFAFTLVFALLCSSIFVACDNSSLELKFMLVNNSEYAVVGYEGKASGALEIPASHNDKPITAIGQGAFSGCDIESLIIPNSVREIGKNAFSNCYLLKNVTMSSNIEKVGQSAFAGCSQINFTSKQNCDYVGNSFNPYLVLVRANKKDFNYITVQDGTKVILDSVFKDCVAIVTMTLPDSVVAVGDYAFSSCTKMKSFNVSETSKLAYIGVNCFENCTNLQKVVLPKSLKEMGVKAFQNCAALNDVEIATDCELKRIPDNAFSYCSNLTSIVIPKNVQHVGASAFTLCKVLGEVTFAKGTKLSSIGSYAFQHCSALTTLNYGASSSAWRNVGKGFGYLEKTPLTKVTCLDANVEI